jgi:hypothetical protein
MPARFPLLRPCALLLSAATLACGDDTTLRRNGRVEWTRLHHRSPGRADLQLT